MNMHLIRIQEITYVRHHFSILQTDIRRSLLIAFFMDFLYLLLGLLILSFLKVCFKKFQNFFQILKYQMRYYRHVAHILATHIFNPVRLVFSWSLQPCCFPTCLCILSYLPSDLSYYIYFPDLQRPPQFQKWKFFPCMKSFPHGIAHVSFFFFFLIINYTFLVFNHKI